MRKTVMDMPPFYVMEVFELLEEAGVGVTPGIDFGRNAEGYVRFSYANSIENIFAGMDRLEQYLPSR